MFINNSSFLIFMNAKEFEKFTSEERTYVLRHASLMRFIPELSDAMVSEVTKRKRDYGNHLSVKPEYSIKLLKGLKGKLDSEFYCFSRHDSEASKENNSLAHLSEIELIAGTVEETSALGVRSAVLAKLFFQDGSRILEISPRNNWAVNPTLVYDWAEKQQ